jgi:hypothetical protein
LLISLFWKKYYKLKIYCLISYKKKDATLGSAVTLIEEVIKTFESLCTEVEFHNIWENIINFIKINNIIPDFPGNKII